MSYWDLLCRARKALEQMDRPMHEVDVFGLTRPNECPIHGKPSSLLKGNICGACWNERHGAKATALEILRELVDAPAAPVTEYAPECPSEALCKCGCGEEAQVDGYHSLLCEEEDKNEMAEVRYGG